jgi:hypothetical protein
MAQMADVPGFVCVGSQIIDVSFIGGLTVKAMDWLPPPACAATVPVCRCVTAAAFTTKLASVSPPKTVTESGKLSNAVSDVSVTFSPAAGAGALRLTEQLLDPGAVIQEGSQLSSCKVATCAVPTLTVPPASGAAIPSPSG